MKLIKPHPYDRAKQKGLSLIELLIATFIIAILASVAVPSMKSLFERKNIATTGDYFVKSLKLARVEAVQRGKTISIYPTVGSVDGDWSQGWSMQYTNDDDPDNIFIETIRSFPAVSGSPVFSSENYTHETPIQINPTGQANPLGTFDLYYDDCTGNERIKFEILASGLVKRGFIACSESN